MGSKAHSLWKPFLTMMIVKDDFCRKYFHELVHADHNHNFHGYAASPTGAG